MAEITRAEFERMQREARTRAEEMRRRADRLSARFEGGGETPPPQRERAPERRAGETDAVKNPAARDAGASDERVLLALLSALLRQEDQGLLSLLLLYLLI